MNWDSPTHSLHLFSAIAAMEHEPLQSLLRQLQRPKQLQVDASLTMLFQLPQSLFSKVLHPVGASEALMASNAEVFEIKMAFEIQ
jgi:hypothetical protein